MTHTIRILNDKGNWHIRLQDGHGVPCGQWLSMDGHANEQSVIDYAEAVAKANPWMCAVHAQIEKW